MNNRQSWVLRDGNLVEERWHKVVVGDIIKMENNQFVAVSLGFIVQLKAMFNQSLSLFCVGNYAQRK